MESILVDIKHKNNESYFLIKELGLNAYYKIITVKDKSVVSWYGSFNGISMWDVFESIWKEKIKNDGNGFR